VDTESRLVLVSGARIDNRLELFDLLDVAHSERGHTPDGALILKDYQKWGPDCCDRLLGDWGFALLDPRRRTLCLARDHHGNTSLYYHQNRHFVAFASSIKSLLNVSEVPRRPDELHLAIPGGVAGVRLTDILRRR